MAGVIAVGLALGILGYHYRDLSVNAAQETKFRGNQEIAKALSLANWALVEKLLDPPAWLSRDELRRRSEVALLRDVVDSQIRSGTLTKVKIYDLSGLTLFSTAEAEIGEDYSHIREIEAVRGGLSVTRIQQGPIDSPGAGGAASVTSIESYVPLRHPEDGSIRGVYEIYANITPFLQRIGKVEDRLLLGIVEVALLYAILILLFWRLGRENRFAQKFLDAVFENHPDMLLAKDARNLRYVRANKAALKTLGVSQKLIGKRDDECFPKAEAEFFSALDQEVLKVRQPLDIPGTSVQTRHGGPRTLRLRKLPIGFGSGMPSLILAIVEDITDQQHAIRALESSEARFRQVIDHAGDALFLHTLDGRFVEVNKQAGVSLGYAREELLRLTVPDVEMAVKPDALREYWALKGGEPMTVTGVHRRKDGTTFPVEVRLAPVTLNEGPGVIALARDITRRVEAEEAARVARERAEIASQEKSDYIGRLGHGLRTPLHAVIGMTDLLLTTRLTRRQSDYVENIRASGELLGTLINDTLDFTRLESGVLRLEQVEFSLGAVAEGVVQMVGYRAYEKGLELVCFLESGVDMSLAGDPDCLREVLVNLVGNAVKFTRQGTVTLSVSRVEESGDAPVFRFTVEDTGVGVPRESQLNLFDPFFQAQIGNEAKYPGSGLGLSISKKLVEAMGGEHRVREPIRQRLPILVRSPFSENRRHGGTGSRLSFRKTPSARACAPSGASQDALPPVSRLARGGRYGERTGAGPGPPETRAVGKRPLRLCDLRIGWAGRGSDFPGAPDPVRAGIWVASHYSAQFCGASLGRRSDLVAWGRFLS